MLWTVGTSGMRWLLYLGIHRTFSDSDRWDAWKILFAILTRFSAAAIARWIDIDAPIHVYATCPLQEC